MNGFLSLKFSLQNFFIWLIESTVFICIYNYNIENIASISTGEFLGRDAQPIASLECLPCLELNKLFIKENLTIILRTIKTIIILKIVITKTFYGKV